LFKRAFADRTERDGMVTTLTELNGTIAQQGVTITELNGTITEQGLTIAQQGVTITELNGTITQQGLTIAQQGVTITELNGTITQQGLTIAQQGVTITELNGTITQQGSTIAQQGVTITELNGTITELNGTITQQGVTIAQQGVTITELNGTITELNGTITQQGLTIAQQGVTITELNGTITQQGLTITELTGTVHYLKGREIANKIERDGDMKRVQDKFDAIEKRDVPITIREAMVLLEREMSIDMFNTNTVSKNTIKKCFLFSAKNIVQCQVPEVITARNAYLKRHNLSDDHLYSIAPLKEKGNIECHENRPVLTRQEWNDVMAGMGDDEDLQMRLELLNLLEHYRPVSTDGKRNLAQSPKI
jgi:uncharacterized coiled-coil protein SlyX